MALREVARHFLRRASPWVIGSALLVVIVARALAGPLTWRDPVVVAGLLAVFPVTEWAIHVYLLHARPIQVAGRRVDLPTAREHRLHHEAPGELDGVLIPVYGILIFLPAIALTAWALSFPIALVLGGDRVAGLLTGICASYAILLTYEWTHYLIHTSYRPRGRYYRSIWRGHRLHHYKNEHYWFGVTTTVGDRILGTDPEQDGVERSRTARSLHAAP